MEILYQIDNIENLNRFPPAEHTEIRWIKFPDDLELNSVDMSLS